MPEMTPAGDLLAGPLDGPRVVLFHGLTASPTEMWPLARGLAAAGFRAEAPMWPGHGGRPEDLHEVGAEQLLARARAVLASGPPPWGVVGTSMGALAALATAPPLPGGLALLAPAVRMAGAARIFDALGALPWPRRLRLLVRKGGGLTPRTDYPMPLPEAFPVRASVIEALSEKSFVDRRYDRIPLRWASELRLIRHEARRRAAKVRSHVLILHGLDDETASSQGAFELSQWCRHAMVSMRFLKGAGHLLTLGVHAPDVVAEVAAFLLHSQEPGPIDTAGAYSS